MDSQVLRTSANHATAEKRRRPEKGIFAGHRVITNHRVTHGVPEVAQGGLAVVMQERRLPALRFLPTPFCMSLPLVSFPIPPIAKRHLTHMGVVPAQRLLSSSYLPHRRLTEGRITRHARGSRPSVSASASCGTIR
ncbi:hypothetical protein NUW58_g10743 [Xylaria curta]|uniref:Uncharacterized protein n=1 Tax=Xylaria curta TaxID=42375 RepID=A0ACC1MGH2_9PEZI|nr:hypothetical protein NUW58_g10743 [Xylaria curta]